MNEHADADAMARAVAGEVAGLIADALAARGRAAVAVAGGSTPAAAAALLFARDLDWGRVTMTTSDERWVRTNDPLSNFGRLRGWVRGTEAEAARLVALADAPGDLAADADAADARVADLAPFDLVWAGMGADGHTLSWFPGRDLAAALTSARMVVAVEPEPPPPEAPVTRLTFTLQAARGARHRLLTATGAAKRAVLDAPGAHPVGYLLALGPSIHWCP